MTVEKFRDALHDIIGERLLYVHDKSQTLMFCKGYLNGVLDCLINGNNGFSDEENSYLDREYDFIYDHMINWIVNGLDLKTEINRIGWNDRKMINEWWYRHGEH